MNKKKRIIDLFRLLYRKFVIPLSFGICLFLSYWFYIPSIQSPFKEEGKPLTLYSNQTQDDLRSYTLSAISEAKESIFLLIYTLKDRHIIDTLRKKGEAGVKVQIICDSKSSKGIAKILGPNISCRYQKSQGLMHQKILIIDKEKIWMGSANFTTESLRYHGNLITALKSPELARRILATTHNEMMQSEEVEEITIHDQKISYYSLPDSGAALKALLERIQKAKFSLKIAQFTWTHEAITEAVIEAAKRGVLVEVIIDKNSLKGASQKVHEKLRQAKIPVRTQLGGGLLHYKMAIIDDCTLINGSCNWTKGAFTKNNDCFLIVDHLLPMQKDKLNKLWIKLMTLSQEPL